MRAPRRSLVQGLFFGQLRTERNTTAEHPMRLCERLGFLDCVFVRGIGITGDVIPWVCLSDVRSPGANQSHPVASEFKVIHVWRAVGLTEIVLHRRIDDWS